MTDTLLAEPDRLVVLGGKSPKIGVGKRPTYVRAVAAEVNLRSGQVQPILEYCSPPDRVAASGLPAHVFKAGTLVGDRLFACTETEVLVLSLPDLKTTRAVSLPCFNDVHHVRPLGDNLLVVCAGLDLVVEIGPDDQILRAWNALGGDPWQNIDPTTDYRRVGSTKPHRSHPNFVFVVGDQIWVTRFEQRDAISLSPPGHRILIGRERVHDGVVFGERVYFTTVDGHIATYDPEATPPLRLIDLGRFYGGSRTLGWCRGLLVLESDRVVVGFSRLRPTRFRENLRWLAGKTGVKEGFGQGPTHIACFDLKLGRLLWTHTLESIGMGAVFSIHPLSRADDPEAIR